ncbi:OLC1v1004530C1 [Oldenlandia corymbosa var. corymbosa]|uniref:OLC1v1004530C1 n=1 Tax=Oldenlandia corymbosa var. corymbosa TaxID=529605 RepID=A0AAV1DCK1_OLDCO|nr:OLC1v1004530C1 [Oldenlandia corymbosa var. corymbosa]
MSRFPSNIDAQLLPQQYLLQHSQSTNYNPHPNLHMVSSNHQGQHAIFSVSNPTATNAITASAQNSNNVNITSPPSSNIQQQQKANLNRVNPAELRMAEQDAWRVCHPDFKRPFSSLEDACERLLPYHVVADYEADEDDKILDSDSSGQMLSRSQQWDHNIAAKVAEFTATLEKQVLAFNIISRKRDFGELRSEEKLMIEQLLLQEERRALLEMRAEMDSRQKSAGRETQESNVRMATMVQAEQAARGVDMHSHAGMLIRTPIRASAIGSQTNNVPAGHDLSQQDQLTTTEDMINGWGNNGAKDEKEPSDDFLNDEETENGDTATQSEWRGGGNLDLNSR